jgi:hypothetical protein
MGWPGGDNGVFADDGKKRFDSLNLSKRRR